RHTSSKRDWSSDVCSSDLKMIYAPRRFRGLGVVNCHWEAFLQHFAIASKLAKHRDGLFHQVHDCAEEMKICQQKLGVEGNTSRALRTQLRMKAYEDWRDRKSVV